jgi:hypothetical protein
MIHGNFAHVYVTSGTPTPTARMAELPRSTGKGRDSDNEPCRTPYVASGLPASHLCSDSPSRMGLLTPMACECPYSYSISDASIAGVQDHGRLRHVDIPMHHPNVHTLGGVPSEQSVSLNR